MPTLISNASFPEGRGNVVQDIRDLILDAAGATTRFYILNPAFETTIQVLKNTAAAVISVTSNTRDEGGVVLLDLEDGDVMWSDVSTGTGDYLAGGNKNLTGVRITSTPVGGDIDISINQVR